MIFGGIGGRLEGGFSCACCLPVILLLYTVWLYTVFACHIRHICYTINVKAFGGPRCLFRRRVIEGFRRNIWQKEVVSAAACPEI